MLSTAVATHTTSDTFCMWLAITHWSCARSQSVLVFCVFVGPYHKRTTAQRTSKSSASLWSFESKFIRHCMSDYSLVAFYESTKYKTWRELIAFKASSVCVSLVPPALSILFSFDNFSSLACYMRGSLFNSSFSINLISRLGILRCLPRHLPWTDTTVHASLYLYELDNLLRWKMPVSNHYHLPLSNFYNLYPSERIIHRQLATFDDSVALIATIP